MTQNLGNHDLSGHTAVPDTWDIAADIVIVGCGMAGTGAALSAMESGCSVVVLEKADEHHAGGDSRTNGGGIFRSLEDPTELVKNSLGQMSMQRARDIAREGKVLTQLLLENGAAFEGEDYMPEMTVPGEEEEIWKSGNSPCEVVKEGGMGVYWALKAARSKAGVPVHYETPARKLILNHKNGQVSGVLAEQRNKAIRVKANKAVILASGGYAGNPQLVNDFHIPGVDHGTMGSPYNTGDGLMMGQEVGVALSRLGKGLEFAEVLFKTASQEMGTGIATLSAVAHDSRILINREGVRFMNEHLNLHHYRGLIPFLDYSSNPFGTWRERTYPNLPMFMVFDQACVDAGPLGFRNIPYGWSAAAEVHNWSIDNRPEIERGWILKADSLQELAAQLRYRDLDGQEVTVSVEALTRTVGAYNAQCASGLDDEFGRSAETMKPITEGPYYAAEMITGIIYTIGGLSSNEFGQAVNYHNQAIPRLYVAGDIGQGVQMQPLGLAGCFACGRLAADQAVNLQSVD